MKMLHYSSTLKKTTNMKKIVKYAAVAALAMVSFVSCDLLDNKPYDTYTKDNYFSSKSNLDLFVNYFYSEFTGYGNGGGYGVFYQPTRAIIANPLAASSAHGTTIISSVTSAIAT